MRINEKRKPFEKKTKKKSKKSLGQLVFPGSLLSKYLQVLTELDFGDRTRPGIFSVV